MSRFEDPLALDAPFQLSVGFGNSASGRYCLPDHPGGAMSAAEGQAAYRPPMTRRLKCRIDTEQSPYTLHLHVLPEHKPVRRGREMIDLLAVEEPSLSRRRYGRCRTRRQRSTSC